MPNYVNLGASPTDVSTAGSITMSWVCDFSRWDYQSIPVNVYLAVIKGPRVIDAASSISDALGGDEVYLFRKGMKSLYRYSGRVEEPTYSNIVFPPAPFSGSRAVAVPSNPAYAGQWIFAAVFIRIDTGMFVRPDGKPVENSNTVIVK